MLKAATMLEARERLSLINVTNFAQLKDQTRDEFSRSLKSAANRFLDRGLKDYKEVLAKLARGLSGGRR